jgi:hypothetical protein
LSWTSSAIGLWVPEIVNEREVLGERKVEEVDEHHAAN